MIREVEPWEPDYPLPELTEAEQAVLDAINLDKVIAKCIAQLPPNERKCWKVTDMWGDTIKRYATREEALESAIERNERAESLGLKMRYRISRDQGYDE